jgi:uncharacterized membrane protein YdbT with pleckstrin-like domain
MAEETIWTGHPSQIVNLGVFAACAALILFCCVLSVILNKVFLIVALFPLALAVWRWVLTKCQLYELSTERLRTTVGVFSKRQEVLELYRIKDMTMVQPLFLRLFGLGNLILVTSDRSDPDFVIPAVRDPNGLLDQVRKHVEIRRDQKRVREVDFDDGAIS